MIIFTIHSISNLYVYMNSIYFVEIKNMEKATEVDDLEKIDEDKSSKIERGKRER